MRRRVAAVLAAAVAIGAFVTGAVLRADDAPSPTRSVRPVAGEPSDVELEWAILRLGPPSELDDRLDPLEPRRQGRRPEIIPIP